ncbi:MAG: hypothetical protein DRO99_04140, partial [Candidatus Aenigmatarchaeota archaeon]
NYTDIVGTSGLVSYWKMNDNIEGEGNNITDEQGNNNATLAGDTNCTVEGYRYGGCYFDGSNDYINLAYGQGVNPATVPLTISMWVKPDEPSANQMIISSGQNPDTNARMYVGHYNGNWGMGIYNSPWGDGSTTAKTEWTNIILVMDGSYANLYINGNFDYKKSYSSYTFNEDIDIGRHPSSPGIFDFNGTIDELAIWNRSLSGEEVWDLYRAGMARFNVTRYNQTDDAVLNYYNDYTSTARASGFAPNTTTHTITANTVIVSEMSTDPTPPKITLNHPSSGLNTTSRSVTFNWTVNDEGSTVWCNLTINNTVNKTNLEVTVNKSYTTAVDGIDHGTYLWNVTCWDGVPNVNTSVQWNFTVYNKPPVVTLVEPISREYDDRHSITLTYNISHDSSLDTCSLHINNGTAHQTDSSVQNGTNQTFDVTMDNGQYNWSVACQDIYGRTGVSGQGYFNISANMTINLSIVPASVPENVDNNVSFFGRANLSNGEDAVNSTIRILYNGMQYPYEGKDGLLHNGTEWWSPGTGLRKRCRIYLNDTNDRTDYTYSANVTYLYDNGCTDIYKAKENSVRVIDSDGDEVPSQVYDWNSTGDGYDGDDMIDADEEIVFKVNLTAGVQEEYYIYYDMAYNTSSGHSVSYSSGTVEASSDYYELIYKDNEYRGVCNTLIGSNCDDCYYTYDLPFTFTFHGNQYDTVYVSTNGVLDFDTASSQCCGCGGTDAHHGENMIAAFWSDLYLNNMYACSYESPNRVVFRFNGVDLCYWYQVNYEVVLYQTGDIQIDYGVMDQEGTGCCPGYEAVGISGTDPTDYIDSLWSNAGDSAYFCYGGCHGTVDSNVTEQYGTATDGSGNYNYTLTVNEVGGNYDVRVNTTYRGIFAEATGTLNVAEATKVTLHRPEDNNVTSNSTVYFNCSVKNSGGLDNVTLYWNYSGAWEPNGTVDLTGTQNSTVFSRDVPSIKQKVVWNCLAWGSGTSDWGDQNRSFEIRRIEVAETITPDTITENDDTNVTVYGHINISTGEGVTNTSIMVYLDGDPVDLVSNNNISDWSDWWNTSFQYRCNVTLDNTNAWNAQNSTVTVNASQIYANGCPNIYNARENSIRIIDNESNLVSFDVRDWNSTRDGYDADEHMDSNDQILIGAYMNANTTRSYWVYFDDRVNISAETGRPAASGGSSAPGAYIDFCGTSVYSDFVPDGYTGRINCDPDSSTGAVFIGRNGQSSMTESELQNVLNTGANIITEWSISDEIYNKIFDDTVSQGSWQGGCDDNIAFGAQYNADNAVWVTSPQPWSYYDGNGNGCGYDMSGWTEVTPLVGWSDSTVGVAYRMYSGGVAFFVEADWQDSTSQNEQTETFMKHMATFNFGSINVTDSFTEQHLTATNGTGDYNYTFTVNKPAGSYLVTINVSYNLVSGSNSQVLIVSPTTVTTLNSPEDNHKAPNATITFNCSVTNSVG